MQAAKRVLRYLNNNPFQGILLSSSSEASLQPIVIMTRRGAPYLAGPPLGSVFFLVTQPYHGNRKNKLWWLGVQLKLNIELWR